jgi:hypothetical protein
MIPHYEREEPTATIFINMNIIMVHLLTGENLRRGERCE